MLKIHDELTAWVLGMNQYKGGRGADRQFYLSCWSGEPAKVNRKSDPGEPLIVPDPFLGVIGCIPPGKLADLDAGNDRARTGSSTGCFRLPPGPWPAPVDMERLSAARPGSSGRTP